MCITICISSRARLKNTKKGRQRWDVAVELADLDVFASRLIIEDFKDFEHTSELVLRTELEPVTKLVTIDEPIYIYLVRSVSSLAEREC